MSPKNCRSHKKLKWGVSGKYEKAAAFTVGPKVWMDNAFIKTWLLPSAN